MDTEVCQWHNLHLAIDGQSQWCSLIPTAQSCNNCLWQSQVMSLQPPLPLSMLRVERTMFTSFMNEDHTSLMIFCWFVVPDEPNCFLCCVYGNDGNLCHPNQNCPSLLDGYQCFKCLRPHLKVDCHNSIPHSPNNCPKCHLLHNEQALVNVLLCEGNMVLIAKVRFGLNDTEFLFGPFGVKSHETCTRPCQNWKTSLVMKSWLDGWDWRL
jgi:hypothetical protein